MKERIYDPRLGKFLSIDPLTRKFAWLTPYQFASNTPIQGIDIDGLEVYYTADGSLIGKIGDNTSVRRVDEKDVKTVGAYVNWANGTKQDKYKEYATGKANQFSCDVGLSNDELNTRAFLGTIRQTEGGGKKLDYDVRFGMGKLDDLKDHPHNSATRWGKTSSASGAYEILTGTWDEVKGKLNLKDFSGQSQDAAAVQIIKAKGALDEVKAGDTDKAFSILKGTWSSFPGGKEQGMKKEAAKAAFKQNVSNELNNSSDLATPQGKLKTE